MSDSSKPPITLPREQQAIRGKCFHPSGTLVEFPKEEIEQSIPARFEKIVRMYPDRLAVKMGDRALTYDQLNQAANRIAHAILKRLGLGSEPIVLLFEQGIDVIAAVLGVLKTGKFYVALDVSSPEERNASIVSDTGATLILTSSRNRDSAHKLAGTRGCVLYCDQIGAATSSENLAIAISQDDKTTISYTSGSTGAPKGVIETHRFRPHDALIYTHAIRISPDDRLSLLHSVSFGTAATNLYQSLLNGASLFPFDLKSEGINRLADWLKEEQITILHSPVASFREFALALSASDKFPRLRAIHLSGSSITQLDVNLYKSKLTERTSLVFHFGATEAGAIAMAVVDPTFSNPSSGTPAGYPLPGKQLMLLNEHNQEVGFGEIGEIAVKSPYLARGYWKNPQLTGAKFLLNPDGGVERTYLTGDLGRLRPDGFLIHLGRKDLMVKIRGYRVEIGEIERTLLSHPLIKDVGVVAWDREPEEKYLVGYVVARYPSAVTVSDLRNFLRNQLPDYMIPRIFVFLDSLPLTNGKLDRGALPKPEGQRPELGQAYGAPQSEIERTIASIWEEVLNIRPIGIHDNLFDLGGHSLSASQIVSRVIETFRLEVPLQKLFESPTVAQMAGWITEHPERMRREEDGVPVGTGALSLRPVPRDKELPLSFAQHRLWLLNQLEPDSPVYNEPKTVRFRGVLDVESLQKTLDTIMERHEVLRTTFSSVDGKPKQVIHTGARLDLASIDLTKHTKEQREADLKRILSEFTYRPFYMDRNWPIRAALIRLDEDEHVLLLVTHHIASDGWSSNVLYRELSALYEACSQGKADPLKVLPIQYADYAVWQRHWLAGEVLDKQLSYWRKQLEGVSPLELPTDRPRPGVQGYAGRTVKFTIPPALVQGLKDFSRQQGVTLFMTLLAAFQALLYRHTGQDDIAVGTPAAARNRPEIADLIGIFINTLVLRNDLSGNPTFKELLGRVKRNAADAYGHQDLPFEKLVEELQPERGLDRNPIFQVMFQLRNYPNQEFSLSNLTIEEYEFESEIAKFDLLVGLREDETGLSGTAEYKTELFDPATIERMVRHFQILLEGIVNNPDQHIAELPLLTASEKHQLLVEWNDTKTDYPREKCVHELFETQVEKSPDDIAVVFEDLQLSYRGLNHKANQFAHYLIREGVQSGTAVGLYLERSIELAVALLAVLKAGGVYVPIDPSYPIERATFSLQDVQAPFIVTTRYLASQLSIIGARTITLDTELQQLDRDDNTNPQIIVGSESPAYILFTSGSTGTPKGVVMSHRALNNLITWQVQNFDHGLPARTLQFAPLGFDVSIQEILSTWCAGGSLYLIRNELRQDGSALMKYIAEHSIERIFMPFVALQHLAEIAVNEDCTPQSLREVFTAGEQLRLTKPLRLFLDKLENCRLINQYGPTESHVVTEYTLDQPLQQEPDLPPIGRPIANSQIYVLDPNLNPVPIGVAGELHIGGDGLARGYLNRPELTAEKFIANPFSNEPGARLYKTGDLARYLPDGNIEFLGRIDNQVKIRGFRIELGEIEAVLAQHPSIQQAVVIAREETPGERRLVAYTVSTTGSAPSTHELRSFLQQKLPDYMVPSAFVFLDSLPLTANGKLDRKSLPAPDHSRPELEDNFVAPRTPVEEILANVWAEILKLDKVGIHDNFFHLGGHSLLATQVISRIRRALQSEIPLRVLFEAPNVARLAERVEESRRQEQGVQTLSLLPVSRDKHLPLSFAQQRLWFLDRYEPNSSVYNMPRALRLSGSLNVAALEQSINELVNRHEALRTTFSMLEGNPVQIPAPSLSLALQVMDLSDLTESERQDEAERVAEDEAHRPFDLVRGPLLRVKLLRLEEQDHVLFITLHHIVSDGWSMGVLYRELSVLYEAFSNGQPARLPDLPLQYADYAVWQREWLQGEVLETQLSYWRKQLESLPAVINLPSDRPRPAVQSYQGARQSIELSNELTQNLKAFSRKNDVTPFMTLLAAFQTLLYRYTSQDDIVVGSPIAGRNRSEIEGLIGFFVNTLVLRTDLSGDPSFRELLGRVRDVALGAYAHEDLPFEKLVEELKPERNLSHSPLFQVMFNMVNVGDSKLDLPGLIVERFSNSAAQSKFDLTLYAQEQSGRLHLRVVYKTDLFDAARMNEMLEQLKRLLEQIVESADERISSYSLVTEKSRRLLPDPTVTIPEHHFEPVTAEFLSWANRSPERTAVCQGARAWTYEELSGSASRIAVALADQGIQRGETVAVTGPRSFGLIGSILGVFLSGGVLLTIDPKLPSNRRRLMIETGRTKYLLYVGEWRQEDDWIGELTDLAIISVANDEGAVLPNGAPSVPQAASLPEISAEDPAYIFFTSGTTGVPKGVLGSHKGLAHFLAWQKRTFEIGPEDRCAQLISLSFDPVLRDIFLPLITGATLCLPDDQIEPASERILSWLDRQNITVLNVVPTLAQTWLGYPLDGVSLRSLRWAFFAGEALPEPLVRRWRDAFPEGGRIVNLYGPTETTLTKCFQVIPDEPIPGVQAVGMSLPQTQALVCNQSGQLCGIGEPGEIVLRTPFRTFGYINAPEEQQRRFVKNPFRDDAYDLVYYTGDRGRYRVDGSLDIIGRLDDQVKIRGVRVEPEEISAQLNRHPGVESCVVVVSKDQRDENCLVAYVVASNRGTTGALLQAYLSDQLPAALIPASFVFLDSLPLSPNGKVDRRALPKPAGPGAERGQIYVAPRTHFEEMLANIWAEILKLDQVGIHDNFFHLGGHSLLATQFVSRVRNSFKCDLPLRTLFEAPTIQGLAQRLQEEVEMAAIIEQHRQMQATDTETEQLLSEVESMTEEQAQNQLAPSEPK